MTPATLQPYPASAHLGLLALRERGEKNRTERTLSASWVDFMTADGTTFRHLDGILGEASTKRDAEVAATVIKWLGTDVGALWLKSTFAIATGEAGLTST